VVILNDGHDTISMLREWFTLHGHVALGATVVDMRKEHTHPREFVQAMKPDVVIFDVGLPYAVNWYYAEMLTLSPPSFPLVLTTANRLALENIVGQHDAFELTGTHENLQQLLAAVYSAGGRAADGSVRQSKSETGL
jgi:hypothetical protein